MDLNPYFKSEILSPLQISNFWAQILNLKSQIPKICIISNS